MPDVAGQISDTPVPTSTVCVSEAEAKKLNVGEHVSLNVSGKVKAIMERYGKDEKGKYDVTIENPSVAYEDMNSPESEKKLKDMPAEEMRKRLPKAEREY